MSIPADGNSTTAIHVVVRDMAGLAVPAVAVQLDISGTGNRLSVPPLTDAQGSTTALLASTYAETKTISLKANTVTLSQTLQVQFVPLDDMQPAATSSIAAFPTVLVADGLDSSTITVTVRNAATLPLPGQTVTLQHSSRAGLGDGVILTPSSGTTDPNGVFQAQISATRGIPATVTAQVDSLQLQTTVNFAVPQCFGTPVLAGVPWPPTGMDPKGLAVGLINGDASVDVAVANSGDGTVSVLLGNGDGTFTDAGAHATASGATQVLIGDFTGDEMADLAVLDLGTYDVAVLPGDGNGTFGTRVVTGLLGGVPVAMAAAYITANSLPDVVVGYANNANVALLVNAGAGTFAANPAYFPVSANSVALAIADLNHDLRPDVVTGATDGNVNVLIGDGQGGFAPAVAYASANTLSNLATGDLNGDTYPDLVLTGEAGVTVLEGHGDGTFGTAHLLPGLTDAFAAVTLVDIDGDGSLDLLLLISGQNTLELALGDGHGNFSSADRALYLGSLPYSMAVADLNGDSAPDILVPLRQYNSLAVTLWPPSGRTFPGGSGNPNVYVGGQPVAADVNGDGFADVLVPTGAAVQVLQSSTDGNFLLAAAPPVAGAWALAANDYNGDHRIDLAVVDNSNSLTVLFGNGDGTFDPNARVFNPNGTPIYVIDADFDRNGTADLAILTTSTSAQVTLYSGDGRGNFAPGQVLDGNSTAIYAMLVAVDVNGDASPDLIIPDPIGKNLSVYLNDGNGTLAAPVGALATTQSAYNAVAAGDFNGDGHTDLAAVHDDGSALLDILLGHGDGTFTVAGSLGWWDQAPRPGLAPLVADYDGDGALDVSLPNADAYAVNVFFGQGDGTFSYATDYGIAPRVAPGAVPPNLQIALGADFNDDGWADIAVANSDGYGMTTLLHSACLPDPLVSVNRGGQTCAAGGSDLWAVAAWAASRWLRRRWRRRVG